MLSFISHSPICNRINSCRVTMETWLFWSDIRLNFTVAQRILIRLLNGAWEMKQRLNLRIARMNHVAILWEFKYISGATVVGTVKWKNGPVWIHSWARWVTLFSSWQPEHNHAVRFPRLTVAGSPGTVAYTHFGGILTCPPRSDEFPDSLAWVIPLKVRVP